jgi:lysophospholipase L1-like esterase
MIRKIILLLLVVVIAAFDTPVKKKIRVCLIGDSTMSVKQTTAYPETGWGMPFVYFFDSTVAIDNRAKNGRSTRTFISENLWQPVADGLQPGDYVFIQFGHNDESPEKTDRYTTPEQYRANITRFVNETRTKKANPVLLTPVSRRKFVNGKAVETHQVYSALVRLLAKELKVPLIDLDKKSMELYQQLGEETSKLLFLQLQPGEHPNYPAGKTDNTHFNELGARLIAQIVLKELQSIDLDLKNHIVKPAVKN